ncbi:hypothetical protein FRC12_025163 [Ceratobasidium sp. 428]|nr:hypothetical protein FRC12_025163 [Ceratobasidium sp. 428]
MEHEPPINEPLEPDAWIRTYAYYTTHELEIQLEPELGARRLAIERKWLELSTNRCQHRVGLSNLKPYLYATFPLVRSRTASNAQQRPLSGQLRLMLYPSLSLHPSQLQQEIPPARRLRISQQDTPPKVDNAL